jgi:putative membrane protein
MEYWSGRNGRRERSVWKGAAAGAIGGFVASWTMNQFQKLWSKAGEAIQQEQSRRSSRRQEAGEEEENVTVKVAQIILRKTAGRPLRREEKQKAGNAVHYGFGTAIGALYGIAAEYVPPVKSAWGMTYGAAIFIGADEIAVPKLGLSKPPQEYPPSQHAYAAASHVVYGATLESVRRAVRAIM